MNLLAANTKNPSTSLISIAGRSVLAAIVSIQVTIVPWTAQAAGTVRCESLFLSTPESGTLLSVLPQDLLRLTTDLKPKERQGNMPLAKRPYPPHDWPRPIHDV